jgi:hypothetical protein
MKIQEQFAVDKDSAHAIAFSEDGTPIAYANEYKKGHAIIFGSFAGQENYEHPVARHPLAGTLAKWAGLSEPKLHAPALLELRQMSAPKGRWVFFFNHANRSASVEFSRDLEKPASSIREIITEQDLPAKGTTLALKAEVPPESVRIYRIDF